MSDLYVQQWNPEGPLSIVLLHAFPLTHAMWEGQIQALKQDCRVIAYDIRGLGKSPLGEGQFTMEDFVDDLRDILDQLKIDQAILCGLSLGGYIALRAIEKFPERVKALVLCDTRSDADDSAGKLKRAKAIRTIRTQGVEAFATAFVPSLLSESTRRERPQVEKQVMEIILSQKGAGIGAAQFAMLSRTDTTETLGLIRCPVLVIHGEQDPLIPLTHAKVMQEKLPNSNLAVIPGAGHLSNLENPEAFNRALLDFLSRNFS